MTSPFQDFFKAQQADGIDHLASDKALKACRDALILRSKPPTWNRQPITVGPLTIDLSAHWFSQEIASHWVKAYEALHTQDAIHKLLSGHPINVTENRPAWHTALRASQPPKEVSLVHSAMQTAQQTLVDSPPSNLPITDIVNIGVGGSDLGPCMVEKGLRPYFPDAPNIHFISNVDSTPLAQVLNTLNPLSTIFIICSKTFTTLETMKNFESARFWLHDQGLDTTTIGRHLFAATSNVEAAKALAIDDDRIFPLWDWVGGRYSVWSAIGLSLVLAFGFETFKRFLNGAHTIDQHFASTPLEDNAPAILASLDAWYGNYFNAQSLAVIPYESSLELLPNYLQQLMMESNGKSTTPEGKHVRWRTGQIIWGGVGTNTQHSFHQLLHQGTQLVPIDFMVGLNAALPLSDHHVHLAANCLAQAEALSCGYHPTNHSHDGIAPHKNVAGNKPFSLFYYDKLNPEVIGAIIALYEHRVFCQSLLWNIFPFDQWGVELGKGISKQLTPALTGQLPSHTPVPLRLEPFIRNWKKSHHEP